MLVLVETDAQRGDRGLARDADVRTWARGRWRRCHALVVRRRAVRSRRPARRRTASPPSPRRRGRVHLLRGRRLGRSGRGRRRVPRRWCWRPGRRGATRCWRTWPAGSTWRWRPTWSRSTRSRRWSCRRQVLGGAALEELRARPTRRRVLTVAGHACEPGAGGHRDRAPVREPLASSVADADLRARVVRTEAGEADESGSAEVRAGRGRRGPRCRQRRRLQGPARAHRAARRRAGRLPRGDQPRLAAAPRAGRPDRQPDLPRPLHRLRHQRRDPALGRAARARRRSWRSTPTRTRRW